MSYELRGEFLEACDCYVMCPCWFERDPDESQCTGLIAWYVEQGQVNGVEVSGLGTVSVSYHAGHRHGAKARVALFVDERASDEQQQALADAFAGKLGGPLAELAEMTEKVNSVHRAPISFSFEASTTKVTVGQAVTVTMRPLVGATDRVITVADSAMANVLGPQAQVGVASSYQLDLPGEGFDLNLEARSANRGRFSYVAR